MLRVGLILLVAAGTGFGWSTPDGLWGARDLLGVTGPAPQESWCDTGYRGRRNRYRHCEVRELTLDATAGTISVDGGTNGGIHVEGWARNEIRVLARVQSWASSREAEEEIARAIRVETGGHDIRADGPRMRHREGWAVSYRLSVPRSSDLDLETHNGGIGIEDVRGEIRFRALNGGISLIDVGGRVQGRTTNGGLDIELSGREWAGEGLDVETTNGGVELAIPEDYSARLETGTVNGGLYVGFPMTVQGRIHRGLRTTLGSGGPTVRAVTTNGGVEIRRR